jgi:ADP-ribosylglycohydrolase
LLGLPAGIGRATLRAILKLWFGFPPSKSGVFSAGNGPAMRSAVLGAAIDDLPLLRSLVGISTRITHTDPKAEYGALAVALAAHMARSRTHIEGATYLCELQSFLPSGAADEILPLIQAAVHSAAVGESALEFAKAHELTGGISRIRLSYRAGGHSNVVPLPALL